MNSASLQESHAKNSGSKNGAGRLSVGLFTDAGKPVLFQGIMTNDLVYLSGLLQATYFRTRSILSKSREKEHGGDLLINVDGRFTLFLSRLGALFFCCVRFYNLLDGAIVGRSTGSSSQTSLSRTRGLLLLVSTKFKAHIMCVLSRSVLNILSSRPSFDLMPLVTGTEGVVRRIVDSSCSSIEGLGGLFDSNGTFVGQVEVCACDPLSRAFLYQALTDVDFPSLYASGVLVFLGSRLLIQATGRVGQSKKAGRSGRSRRGQDGGSEYHDSESQRGFSIRDILGLGADPGSSSTLTSDILTSGDHPSSYLMPDFFMSETPFTALETEILGAFVSCGVGAFRSGSEHWVPFGHALKQNRGLSDALNSNSDSGFSYLYVKAVGRASEGKLCEAEPGAPGSASSVFPDSLDDPLLFVYVSPSSEESAFHEISKHLKRSIERFEASRGGPMSRIFDFAETYYPRQGGDGTRDMREVVENDPPGSIGEAPGSSDESHDSSKQNSSMEKPVEPCQDFPLDSLMSQVWDKSGSAVRLAGFYVSLKDGRQYSQWTESERAREILAAACEVARAKKNGDPFVRANLVVESLIGDERDHENRISGNRLPSSMGSSLKGTASSSSSGTSPGDSLSFFSSGSSCQTVLRSLTGDAFASLWDTDEVCFAAVFQPPRSTVLVEPMGKDSEGHQANVISSSLSSEWTAPSYSLVHSLGTFVYDWCRAHEHVLFMPSHFPSFARTC